jgi:dTDP-4-amino-4,6-dideoxygalactose transaminase
MKAIMKISADHGLAVVDDACQAHGAAIGGRKCGSFDVGCFSFYPTKNMTTGEGGMITTDDPAIAEKARLLREHGMKVRYHHDILGYNLRMTDIGAAIGIAQTKKLEAYNEKRIANAAMLSKALDSIKGIVRPVTKPGYRHVFHQYTIRVTPEYGMSRDDTLKMLNEAGVGTGIYYPVPIHKQVVYRDLGYDGTFPVSEQLSREVISLPVHPSVTPSDIQVIAGVLRRQ